MNQRLNLTTLLFCTFCLSTASLTAQELPAFEAKSYCDDPVACSNLMRKVKIYATNGSPKAQLYLAVAYLNGDGIELSKRKAMKWIKKAAKNPYPKAHRVLSGWYRYGHAGETNLEKADYYLKLAAEAGDIKAMIAFGSMLFENGKHEHAKQIFTKAAERGSSKAQQIIDLMNQSENTDTQTAVAQTPTVEAEMPKTELAQQQVTASSKGPLVQTQSVDQRENVLVVTASHTPVELLTMFVEDTHPMFKNSHTTGSRLPGVKCGRSAATSPCRTIVSPYLQPLADKQ